MKIHTIIPILNPDEPFFTKTMCRLKAQSIKTDILLINSGSTLVDTECMVINIEKHTFNHADTRNIALRFEDDFYLFMTQDAVPVDDDLIKHLVRAFEDENVMVAYARQIPYSNANPIEVFARTTNYPEQSVIKTKNDLKMLGIKTFFTSDSCAMYRGEYFRMNGGFKSGLNTSEDMEFAARAIMDDKKVAYMADAKVYHSHNFTLLQVWQRYREIGKFFSRNRWILETVAQHYDIASTGAQQALQELQYLSKHSVVSIPRSIILSLLKYIAFKSSIR